MSNVVTIDTRSRPIPTTRSPTRTFEIDSTESTTRLPRSCFEGRDQKFRRTLLLNCERRRTKWGLRSDTTRCPSLHRRKTRASRRCTSETWARTSWMTTWGCFWKPSNRNKQPNSSTSCLCVRCRNHFYQFGEIRNISIVAKQQCAFVQFTSRTAAEQAAEKSFNKVVISELRWPCLSPS